MIGRIGPGTDVWVDLGPTAGREQAGRRQPRTISRRRISGIAGQVEGRCFEEIRRWLADFLQE